jgi:acyl-CoA thioester hydrolase
VSRSAATGDPQVTISRYVEWPDTDAAGHYHHSTVIRWMEAAEAELYSRHGLLDLFGVVPRVHLEVRHRVRLWFRDQVEISLRVERLGRSSITFGFTVHRAEELAVEGSFTAVHIDPAAGRSVPWPEVVRTALQSVSSH